MNQISLKNMKFSNSFPKINWLLETHECKDSPPLKEKIFKFSKGILQNICINSLESVIGLKTFNKNFYSPVKKYIKENRFELIKTVNQESFYDLEEDSPYMDARIFVQASFEVMKVNYNKNNPSLIYQELEKIAPKEGSPCVFILNHPFGIVDTLFAAKLMSLVRPDIKFLANSMVSKFCPEIKSLLLDIDVMQSENNSSIKSAANHLNNGGMIIMFPDPTIPFKDSWYKNNQKAYQNLDFKKGIGQLLLASPKASVLMGSLGGSHQNSKYFHFMSNIHPVLKMISLLGEFVKTKGNQNYEASIAPLISSGEIQPEIELEKKAQQEKSDNLTELEKSKYLAGHISKILEKKYKNNFKFLVKKK